MSLIYSGSATATVAGNTNSIAISGLDLGTVLPGMTISLGARGRLSGDAYIIATITPSGTSGGTLTVLDPVASAYTSAGFVIDTRDFNGTAPNYLIASYTQVLNALLRLTSPLTNLFTGSRQVALDKDNSGAISRLLFAISGRTWAALEQRSLTYTPTGAAQSVTESVALRVYADGTTPVDTLLIDVASGGADLRKASVTMGSAATVDLGSAPTGKVAISGSATIVSFGVGKHLERLVHFVDGGATLTHNATSLILPGRVNITTAAGDCLHATSDASGNWRVRSYDRASGKGAVSLTPADVGASGSGTTVLTGTPAQGAAALGLGLTSTPSFGGIFANGAPGTYRAVTFQSNNLSRFVFFAGPEPETGGNNGSNFAINRYADNGDYIDSPLSIARATGRTTLTTLTVTGPANFASSFINGPPNIFKTQTFQSNGLNRWVVFVNSDPEVGGNAGSNFGLTRNDDAGNFLDVPFSIARATGQTTLTSLQVSGITTLGGQIRLASYTVSTLPAGTAGAVAYASNGRKVGEGSGSGTGVIVYNSNNNWRRLSDDQPVLS